MTVSRIQAVAIREEELLSAVRSGGDGAVALFLGTVRDHNKGRKVLHLEYQAYGEMADAEMAKIERQARERFAISAVAMRHRVGRLEVGEISVAVAVASPHRAEAFDACRFIMDALKRTVPVWKKEFFEGGEIWIEGE